VGPSWASKVWYVNRRLWTYVIDPENERTYLYEISYSHLISTSTFRTALSGSFATPFAVSATSFASFSTAFSTDPVFWLLWYKSIRVTCVTPTPARRKLTAANLPPRVSLLLPCTLPQRISRVVRKARECLQHILRPNNKAPPRPYYPRSRECQVLRKRKVLRWSREVAGAGKHERPLSRYQDCPSTKYPGEYRDCTFITGALLSVSICRVL